MSKTVQYTDAEGCLSPNGKMFFGPHVDVAFRFFAHADDPYRRMEEAGWWRLRVQRRKTPEWVGLRPATPQQRQYITRWVQERNYQQPHEQMKVPAFRGIEAELARVQQLMST